MTWNEFVSYVQLEIDKSNINDPQVDYIGVTNPDQSHPSTSLIVSIVDNQLTIIQ